jgi:MFS family permease
MKFDRNIASLMAFATFIGITIGFNFTFLPVHIEDTLGGSLYWVGFIVSLQYLALVVMTFVWGAVSDKLGQRRNVILIGNFIASFFYFFMPDADLVQLTLLRSIQVFFNASWILAYALSTELSPRSKGEIIGLFTLFNSVGWGLGSFMSGFVYEIDIKWFFYLSGIFSLLAAGSLLPLNEPLKKKVETLDLRRLFKLDNIPDVMKLCITVLFLITGSYMVFAIFSVYLNLNDIPKAAIGIVIALSGLPSAGLSSLIGRLCDLYGRKIILLISIALYAFIWLVYGIVDNIWIVIALWLIPAYTFYMISTNTMMSDLTAVQERGRGIGLLNSFYNMGAFAGSLAGGALAAIVGFKPTFLIAAGVIIISFFMALRLKETK